MHQPKSDRSVQGHHLNPHVPVNEPLLEGNEAKHLTECIETGWISSEGPFVSKFEEGMAAIAGQHYGIAVSSGSAALEVHLALRRQ